MVPRTWLLVSILALPRVEASELLPAFSARAEGARFVPADVDFEWVGWVGAGATLLRAGRTSVDFDADIETIMGDERRWFDANQGNYHLELGARRPWRRAELALFYHHVSRHALDREKPEVRNWNVLGLRLRGPLPAALGRPGRAALSLGPVLFAFELGYRFEAEGSADMELVPWTWGQLYASGLLRFVEARPTPEFPRGDFLDGILELGVRWRRAGRSAEVFAAFERRNDASLFVPQVRTGGRIGLRLAFESEPR
jgi:hypothetical protein